MQLTRVFGSLADTYGHILRTNLAEVDLKDVVLNRRIMVVLLPALEKSPDELSNLGKIIIASLKAMMAAGLGDAVEGDYRDVILRKPTNAPSPYMCIMDEYGYYAVQGFAVVPAQARSLGFSAIFAGQDLPAFQKASKEEAASIGANCNIKICMKLEDPQETWEFFNRVAGETYVTNVSGFLVNSGSMAMNYMDSKNANVDRRQRIEILDLKDQREGEAHIFFKSKIIRAEMFYANPKPVKRMRINHFIKVEPPAAKEIQELLERLKQFKNVFTDPSEVMSKLEVSTNEDLDVIVQSLHDNSNDSSAEELKPFERGVAALISLLEHEIGKQKDLSSAYETEEPSYSLSIFNRTPVTPIIQSMIGDDNVELFALPLLRRGATLEELKHIEQLAGSPLERAERFANSIITDIERVTSYPPEVQFERNPMGFKQDLIDVIQLLGGRVVDDPIAELEREALGDNPFDFSKLLELPDLDGELDDDDDDDESGSSDGDDSNDGDSGSGAETSSQQDDTSMQDDTEGYSEGESGTVAPDSAAVTTDAAPNIKEDFDINLDKLEELLKMLNEHGSEGGGNGDNGSDKA
jgi:intracellular multiplication protein IcmO